MVGCFTNCTFVSFPNKLSLSKINQILIFFDNAFNMQVDSGFDSLNLNIWRYDAAEKNQIPKNLNIHLPFFGGHDTDS